MPRVTLVTANAASADQLTDADYRDIYDELREKASLDKFVTAIGSTVSKAWWSKYERGEAHLDRKRKAELRRAVGLPDLPRAVTEVAATINPDARVWQVGVAQPDRVVLVGSDVTAPLDLRMNGNLELDPAPGSLVTSVTGARRNRSYKSLSVSVATYQRLAEARVARNLTWDEYLSTLLESQP